jgi:hypothetical protein
MNTSTFRSETIEQITVTVEGFKARALLTRFAGERTWAVRGANFERFDVVLRDGERERFLKSTAMRLAEQFIRTGREYL